jgi:ABC-type phosphate/phosphonate transport system substrate-binding protein
MIAAVSASADNTFRCHSKTTLSFGMVPMVSARLTDLWTSKINRQVQKKSCFKLSFSSAGDFEQYIDKARQGHFDVLAVPPHIASYLIATAGFKPVAFLVWESSYLYVVPDASSITSIDQIAGGTIALPDPLAEASILAQKEISVTHSDVSFQHYGNFNQIIKALLAGSTDVGIVLSPFYNAYKKRAGIKVRVVHEMPFPSHGMLLAAPHTSEYSRAKLFETLASFEANSGFFWKSFDAVSQQQIETLHRVQAASVETLKRLVGKD